MVTKNVGSQLANPKSSKSNFGCFSALIVGILLVVGSGLMISWSTIRGIEFSPMTFQARSFAYSRIPGTQIRLTSTTLGTPRSVAFPDVLKHLRTLSQTPEWHIASVSSSPEEQHSAGVLLAAFNQRHADGNDFWGGWSFRNPTMAAVLWPLVQSLAMQRLYDCLPEILAIAEISSDAAALEKNLLQVIADTVSERRKRSTEQSQSTELMDWFEGLSVAHSVNADWLAELKERVRKTRGPTEF